MSRLRLRRKWQDSYACRRHFFLFVFFCFAMTLFFKTLKIIHEEEHRNAFHQSVGKGLDNILNFINREDP